MKSIWPLLASIFQLAVGVSTVTAFVVLAAYGEDMTRWIITLVLALGYIVMGVMGIIEWRSK